MLEFGGIGVYIIEEGTGVYVSPFFMSGSTVLGLTFSDEKLSGAALQSPLRLLILSLPVMMVGLFAWRKMRNAATFRGDEEF